MNSIANSILIEKSKKFLIGSEQPYNIDTIGDNINFVATFQANLEKLGFGLTTQAIYFLSNIETKELLNQLDSILNTVKKMVGAHRKFTPMYPNFPKQVMEADDLTLFINALIHYAGDSFGFRFMPAYKEDKRKKLPESDKVDLINDKDIQHRIIDIGYHGDVESLFNNLISSNVALPENDKSNVVDLFNYLDKSLNNTEYFINLLNSFSIPQKENKVFLSSLIYKKYSNIESIKFLFDTPTDVLRFVVNEFSMDKDISLSIKPVFISMKRKQRRDILNLLNLVLDKKNLSDSLEEVANRKETWIRLGEKIHAGEYAQRFVKSGEFFKSIHSPNKIETQLGRVDKFLKNNQFQEAINELMIKPGVFARNFRKVISNIEQSNLLEKDKESLSKKALVSLEEVASKVATPILLQLYHQFKSKKSSIRTFIPKGATSKFYVQKNTAKTINKDTATQISEIAEKSLVSRFSSQKSLGKVFVDKSLTEQLIPFAMRSASKALKTVARGSKIKLQDKDTFRLFVWWKQPENDRVDIDLSVVFLNEKYNYVDHCSFTNLKGEGFTHSGDITSAPNGAAEFIDITKSKLNPETRYVVLAINSYTSQSYADLPECFAGYMERTEAQSGKIFSARTVQNKFDITADSEVVAPLALDIKTNKLIWLDMALKNCDFWNMVESQNETLANAVKAFNTISRPNLYDLFMLHAKARGQIVSNKKDADTIFSMEKGITPYDYEIICSEFMA